MGGAIWPQSFFFSCFIHRFFVFRDDSVPSSPNLDYISYFLFFSFSFSRFHISNIKPIPLDGIIIIIVWMQFQLISSLTRDAVCFHEPCCCLEDDTGHRRQRLTPKSFWSNLLLRQFKQLVFQGRPSSSDLFPAFQ